MKRYRMRRREFIAGVVGGAALASLEVWPLTVHAQQGKPVRRVGVLMNSGATEVEHQAYLAAFIQGLRQLGWIEGQNVRVNVRWNAADAGLARIYGAQLIGLMPDVILVASTTNLAVIRQATSAVPIVFIAITDPVAQGFVASMSRPGGNLTGFSNSEFSIGGKWVGLLKEFTPSLTRVLAMFNPDTSPQSKFYMRAIDDAAQTLGVKAIAAPVRSAGEIEAALESFASVPDGGVILPSDSFTHVYWTLIADLAGRYRLPSIAATIGFAKDGGLIDYGVSINLVANTDKRRATSIAFSRALKPPTCRFREPIGTGSSSISRPRRRLESKCRRKHCCVPTRSLNRCASRAASMVDRIATPCHFGMLAVADEIRNRGFLATELISGIGLAGPRHDPEVIANGTAR